jgi:hypothetical protein
MVITRDRYNRYLIEIQRLMVLQRPNPDEEERLERLVLLVIEYEEADDPV